MEKVAIAQLGERKTEDLKVTGSIPVGDISFAKTDREGWLSSPVRFCFVIDTT